MAFKFALVAAAAASRIAREVDSPAAREKKIKDCRDERPWRSCIEAFAAGECNDLNGCDRTCGKCATEACYDRIPMPHTKMFEDSVPARAMWPTLSNRNGENSFPRLSENEDAAFPFEEGTFSSFCLDVFKNGLCNSYDSLTLTYDDGTSIFLAGMPIEYCAFTCGACKAEENKALESCFFDHNNIMNTLSSQNAAPIYDFGMFGFGSYEGGESESSYFDYDTSESESSESSEESEEGGDWEHSWGDWGRKRRSAALEKREIIVSAIEAILSGRNARTKRSFDYWGIIEESNPGTTENLAEKLENCNNMLLRQDDSTEIEGEEPTEVIEPAFNPLEDIVARRQPKDFSGIRSYFDEYLHDNVNVDVSQCQWVEFVPEGEIEDFAGLELTYDCPVSCPAGHSLKTPDEVVEGEELRVNCSKDKRQATNMLRDSICESAMYCLNGICKKIECVQDEAEEAEESAFSEWGQAVQGW